MDRPQDGREGQVASQENVGAEDQPVEAGTSLAVMWKAAVTMLSIASSRSENSK